MEQELSTLVREKMSALDTFQADVKKDLGDFREQHRKDMLGINSEIVKLKSLPMSRAGFEGGNDAAETLGRLFIKSQQFKIFRETGQQRSGKMTIDAKAITKAVTPITSPTYPVPTQRVETAPLVHAPLTARALLRPIPVGAGAIEYLRVKPTVGTAGVQYPQGTTKASVTMSFELATANVATTAVYTKASRQVLDDDAQLMAIIDGELMYLVDLAEELEILNGDGSAGHMAGILTLAPTFTHVTGTSSIDIIGQAIGQLQALGYQVTGVLVNPSDWVLMQQAKASADGSYLIGNPGQGATPPYLWNLPVIPSSNIVAGTFLTGAFGTAAQLYDRESKVEVALENEDDFIKNLATILAERRSALVYRNPAGFLQGSLVATP